MLDNIKKHWPDHAALRLLLVAMGVMIVIFNVKGYDELFSDEPWFGLASPFGILLGLAEFAVLVWTSAVIRSWPNASRVLKFATYILVPAFFFLCYSGINSYLTSLATKEIRLVEEVKTKNANNTVYLTALNSEVDTFRQELALTRVEREKVNIQINSINQDINEIQQLASDRRREHKHCHLVEDCKSAVAGFENNIKRLEIELQPLYGERLRIENSIEQFENDIKDTLASIKEIKLSNTKDINEHAGSESSFTMKKAAYEKIIISIYDFFNLEVKDPFGVFVSVLSGVIYPVYFILNLFLALNSEENLAVRKDRREKRAAKYTLWKKLIKIFRTMLLRKKKLAIENLNKTLKLRAKKKSHREHIYKKMIRYFRVWAHRRNKVIEREVEKIVVNETMVEVEVDKVIEVPVEIEKEVEVVKEVEVQVEVEKVVEVVKEVPVEVRVEVPVEVDKIVEVPTEVPVYVEKIKKEPEPFFIKDPQVIIHERIIPVPENITGPELEKLLNAKHGSDRPESIDESEVSAETSAA